MGILTDFAKGVICGALVAIVVFSIIAGLMFYNKRNKELIDYAERQIEFQELREDYVNRDPIEFINDIPGVRGAADNARTDFDRKRDEVLQRFRSGYFD